MALPPEAFTPAATEKASWVLGLFQSKIEAVRKGEVKRFEFLTLTQEFGDDDWSIVLPEYSRLGGREMFTEIELIDAAQQIFNQLTGEENGWSTVDAIVASEKPQNRKPLDNYFDLLTWTIDTVDDGVQIGVDKRVDDRGEWVRTYYLAHHQS